MTPLTYDEFLSLRGNAETIESDGHGEKVLLLNDGSYLKLFRRKRLLSSAALYPYAERFADNAVALNDRGIACPRILGVYRVSSLRRDIVHYAPLEGRTLRQVHDEAEKRALRIRFGAFVAELHNQGVFFRSLHLGNVVIDPSGRLGLIDIADMSAGKRALGKRKRLRNFRHILRYPNDRIWLISDGDRSFFNSYAETAKYKISVNELIQLSPEPSPHG
ncbi:toluene tolerance protein [Stutzerimonas stutzeri]|jgi:hypothetical protein|uniref:Toluene tolerance protein n=1 Tax=Stutzerimonas stutzeri TaxID=316 RepID=A0A0D9AJ08_STUST|nr:toluene tolerance protein [Stutzerimonas stutzeri]KJH79356.1 toluene tolerance protein [Stutzerimonas stutzeri]